MKGDVKFAEKLTCSLENDMKNLANFHQNTQKSQNWDFDWIFIQSRKCISLNFTEELCVMAMRNGRKFEKELTCCFKIDMRSLTNFDLSTKKPQKFAL